MKRVLLAFFVLLVLAGVGGTAALWHFAHRPGPLQNPVDHVVPHGSTIMIAHDLAGAGIIPNGRAAELQFRLLARLTKSDGALHAAELHFVTACSVLDVLNVLRHGTPVSHHLTIPEGRTARQITTLIAQDPLLSGPMPEITEGALLPQTIAYERGASRKQIVHRLETLMTQTLARVWAGRDSDPALKTPHELLVLASMVERETGDDAERPQVARVFLNRLSLGMKLQSDPTAIYDLSDGLGVLDHAVTHDELHMAGPHNTYEIAALPPGPICSPGLAALNAVAHPAAGDMLYFVADGTGKHGFSHDLHEHNQRVEALRMLKPAHKAPVSQPGRAPRP
ncbi:endolytic transglycosylase MltG [Asaia sp. BMEF1]|uniref:endolytic transglycosylase MltG n=1 Tax=Asaia sp. BMEF1 TaxID=3155932 RepID=UPI003F67B563